MSSTLKSLSLEDATGSADEGAAFVDLRPVPQYLNAHIPRSLSLLYESGPGFQSRARDCIPLDVPLVLLAEDGVDMVNAAASLRGRGFDVLGQLPYGTDAWSARHGPLASTESYRGPQPSRGIILDVADPGTRALQDVTRIPIERLWSRTDELKEEPRVVVVAGHGVRAALAVGILERIGTREIVFWQTRNAT